MAEYDSTPKWANAILRKCRNNALRREIPFHLTALDIARLAKSQRHRCAVSGLAFDDSPRDDGGRVRPFMPSIDRINSHLPYVKHNVRLVCAAVNAALGDWGDDIFGLIALAYCERMGWTKVAALHGLPTGVSRRPGPVFEVNIRAEGKRWYLGSFKTAEAAGESYERARDGLGTGMSIREFLPRNSRQRALEPIIVPSEACSPGVAGVYESPALTD